MRIAVVSDIHANLTALDAVIVDLQSVGADLVVHGGDLVGGGTRPAEVIDRIPISSRSNDPLRQSTIATLQTGRYTS